MLLPARNTNRDGNAGFPSCSWELSMPLRISSRFEFLLLYYERTNRPTHSIYIHWGDKFYIILGPTVGSLRACN